MKRAENTFFIINSVKLQINHYRTSFVDPNGFRFFISIDNWRDLMTLCNYQSKEEDDLIGFIQSENYDYKMFIHRIIHKDFFKMSTWHSYHERTSRTFLYSLVHIDAIPIGELPCEFCRRLLRNQPSVSIPLNNSRFKVLL